jgi:aminopeptidase-like protein
MNDDVSFQTVAAQCSGKALHDFAEELYPICRSITGEGVRETLRKIHKRVPLDITEVPSGTQVFDWSVPDEWTIRDAYIADATGRRVVDFRRCNLHVISYSSPVRARMHLGELKKHMHSLPDHPDWIPYRTTYYKSGWGFCLSYRQLQDLRDGEYDVCIDSSIAPGSLSYGECVVKGRSDEEVLVSCHICHPSLCNDNLSGITVATALFQILRAMPALRYTYRLLLIPGTIGSITWLARNREHVRKIKHGMVVTGVGDAGHLTYKRSRRGNAEIDRAVEHVLKQSGRHYAVIDFFPYGYDERQYCSPGFNLPVGCLMRTPHGTYPEYHTSADDLQFIKAESLEESLQTCLKVITLLEGNKSYLSTNPYCEPRLGKRGLYRTVGGEAKEPVDELAMLWVLNLSDGTHSLLDIAERAGLAFEVVQSAAGLLKQHGLLTDGGL